MALESKFGSPRNPVKATLPGRVIFGVPGEPGGYYAVSAFQPDSGTLRLTFTPSNDTMEKIPPVDIALPKGPKGDPGQADETQVQQLVQDYLVQNPPKVDEKDPTVPEWAKQPQKPAYTAKEVGALAQEDLQAGIDEALAQAKQSGEFDGKDGQDGQDGSPGKDGVTPTFSIGAVETLDPGSDATASVTGTPERPVLNLGIPQGAVGIPGYTPVRGTDYWTSADIAEIKSYVDEAILGGAW